MQFQALNRTPAMALPFAGLSDECVNKKICPRVGDWTGKVMCGW